MTIVTTSILYYNENFKFQLVTKKYRIKIKKYLKETLLNVNIYYLFLRVFLNFVCFLVILNFFLLKPWPLLMFLNSTFNCVLLMFIYLNEFKKFAYPVWSWRKETIANKRLKKEACQKYIEKKNWNKCSFAKIKS